MIWKKSCKLHLTQSFLTVCSSSFTLYCCYVFSKEDVEKCKQKDLLEQTMSEMIGEFPALHQTIVAERDIYLTHTLRQATRCVETPSNAQSAYHDTFQKHHCVFFFQVFSSLILFFMFSPCVHYGFIHIIQYCYSFWLFYIYIAH